MRHPLAWGLESEPERHAPVMGEHTDEVLREAGLDDDAIDALKSSGAVIQSGS